MAPRGEKRAAGPLFFAVCALLTFGGAYAIWPPEFLDTRLASMPPAMLLRAVASPLLAIIGVEFLIALAIVLLTES